MEAEKCNITLLSFSREDQDPLYSQNNKMDEHEVTGQTNALVSPDWERELMDAGKNIIS